ncbi:uncharacterized protein LY79DRAFT_253703 [Colletotrichum navitas]|uniref:Uncharacterized protein n=1 Tax=Colletotrichum navitas TaxID=681940 RepID=A0AAD8VB96_9PEZI|nr:uncharacterized protein LY79DRAFT_253703 [Colletotrichum navitas]KAK1598731.1 hypothetical protein LY79DRAFT_253703 [Colletotrichum navitas]
MFSFDKWLFSQGPVDLSDCGSLRVAMALCWFCTMVNGGGIAPSKVALGDRGYRQDFDVQAQSNAEAIKHKDIFEQLCSRSRARRKTSFSGGLGIEAGVVVTWEGERSGRGRCSSAPTEGSRLRVGWDVTEVASKGGRSEEGKCLLSTLSSVLW